MQQNPWQPVTGAPPEMWNTPPAAANRSVSAIEAVKFIFSSPAWVTNVLLGFVFSMIPIAGALALQGWESEIHQRLARRHPQPIPKLDFSDFMHYLQRGVASFVVMLVIGVPMALVAYGGLVVVVFMGLSMVNQSSQDVAMVMALGGMVLFAVVMIAVTPFMSGALTRAELTEDIGGSLSLGPMFSYGQRTWGRCVIAMLVFGPVAIGVMLLGMMLCFVGLYPAMIVIRVASMHLRWQIYENQLASGGEAIAVKVPVVLPSEARAHYGAYPQGNYQHGNYQRPY